MRKTAFLIIALFFFIGVLIASFLKLKVLKTTSESTYPSPSLFLGEMVIREKVVKDPSNRQAEVIVNSQNQTISGIDAILVFDPLLVKIGKITPNEDLFKQIVVNRQKEKEGRIKITAYLPKKEFFGDQTLAFFDLNLLKEKEGFITLEFLGQNETKDSNIIVSTNKANKEQKDILGQVTPLYLKP